MTELRKKISEISEAASMISKINPSLINSAFTKRIDASNLLVNTLMGQPEIVASTLAEAEKNFNLIERKIIEGNAILSEDLWENLRVSYRDQVDKWKNHITQK